MKRDHASMGLPFCLGLLAAAFCVWSALGNDVNFCVTTGCTLYQDTALFGFSLWWYGAAAFGMLSLLALLGLGGAGRWLAALCLFLDLFFLALMAMTAPCVSCLAAAFFFAAEYYLFRRGTQDRARKPDSPQRRSVLLLIWMALFVINLGAVARSQLDVWPILDESGDAKTRMFFSPSCAHCIEGIDALSGRVDVAFYPVAENDDDVRKVAKMLALLDEGLSIAEALEQAQTAGQATFAELASPEWLLLRFRLLRNKAHIFAANSRGVPFFEERGLPQGLRREVRERERRTSFTPAGSAQKDHRLPIDTGENTQCGAGLPCP